MEAVTGPVQVLVMGQPSGRLSDILSFALRGVPARRVEALEEVRPGPLLFAASIGKSGVNLPFYALLDALYENKNFLRGCTGGAIIDGETDLYTRSAAQQLLLRANTCGCRLPGRPLVEGIGSLYNFKTLAELGGVSLLAAYRQAAAELVQRLCAYRKPALSRPRVLTLFAGNKSTSNTYSLWGMVAEHLGGAASMQEIALHNGAVADCKGCSYSTCLHMGQQGYCFYGGVIVEEVYPALLHCDALMMLCPNYNDAVDANLAAFINRLTALYRTTGFYEKSLFAIIISGYSGGDIVARQLISGLCINKSFQLPPVFSLLETANAPGSIYESEGIRERARSFAEAMLRHLQP